MGRRGSRPGAAEASAPDGPAPTRIRRSLRWWLLLLAGVAVMGAAGYLVAALVLFPSPLLPNERQVPRILGLAEAAARREVERADLTVRIAERAPHPSAAVGTIVWQDPPPGVAVPKGSAVALMVSAGRPRVMVPDVRGFDLEMARRLLAAAGLHAETVDTSLAVRPSGTVAAVEPAPGDSANLGSSVILHLAK